MIAIIRTRRWSSRASGVTGRWTACVSSATRPRSVPTPVASTTREPLALHHERAGVHQAVLLDRDRHALPGQDRLVEQQAVRLDHPQVGAHAVAGLRPARRRRPPGRPRRSRCGAPSRTTVTRRGTSSRSRSRGALGAVLLEEREHAVEQHHGEDRDAELGEPARRSPAGRRPTAAPRRSGRTGRRADATRASPAAVGSTFGPSWRSRAAASLEVSPRNTLVPGVTIRPYARIAAGATGAAGAAHRDLWRFRRDAGCAHAEDAGAAARTSRSEAVDDHHPRSRARVRRCRTHRHRQQVAARPARRPGAGRLRAVPGPQGAAARELEAVPRRPCNARRRRADPRPHRPLRLPAAPRQARLRGPGVLHARDRGAGGHRAARQRPPPGGGGRVREPDGLLEARPGEAALHGRRREGRARAAATRWRSARPCRCCRGSTSPGTGQATSSAPRSSASELHDSDTTVVFSGDLGRPDPPAAAPARPDRARRRGRDRVDLRRHRAPPRRPGRRDRGRRERRRQVRRRRGDPGVRRRPHRGGALAPRPARGDRAGAVDPRDRRQPDGVPRPRLLPRGGPARLAGDPSRAARARAVPGARRRADHVGRRLEGAQRPARPDGDRVGVGHGDGRPCGAPPREPDRRPPQHRAARRIPGTGHAWRPAALGRHDAQAARPVPAREGEDRRRSTCRRTPTSRSCSTGSPPPARPGSCTSTTARRTPPTCWSGAIEHQRHVPAVAPRAGERVRLNGVGHRVQRGA